MSPGDAAPPAPPLTVQSVRAQLEARVRELEAVVSEYDRLFWAMLALAGGEPPETQDTLRRRYERHPRPASEEEQAGTPPDDPTFEALLRLIRQ